MGTWIDMAHHEQSECVKSWTNSICIILIRLRECCDLLFHRVFRVIAHKYFTNNCTLYCASKSVNMSTNNCLKSFLVLLGLQFDVLVSCQLGLECRSNV